MPIYSTGTRVKMHPATDAWMRGDRWGVIVAVHCRKGHVVYHVLCDRSGKVRRVSQGNIVGGDR